MPDIPEPTVEVTAYRVSCLPADHPEAYIFSLKVERRSSNPDRWAVTDGVRCYTAKGTKGYESNPSSRTKNFLRWYRHSLEDALALAKRIAPTMTCNGFTIADVLARRDVRRQRGPVRSRPRFCSHAGCGDRRLHRQRRP